MEIFLQYLRMRARIQMAANAASPEERARAPCQPKKKRLRKPRVFRPRQTLEGLLEEDVARLYCLPSATIFALYELVKDDIEPKTRRSNAVMGITKLLSTLHFLVTGSFQPAVAVAGGFSQPTFCRFFTKVIHALLKHVLDYIYYPRDPQEWQEAKQAFRAIANIPDVMGAISCTHVAFVPSQDMEEVCRNGKDFLSMNMQVTCDANRRILNVFAAFPGSAHDTHVLLHSSIFRDFENSKLAGGWLLGDSRYGPRSWLLTPLHKPRKKAEKRYNQAHQATHAAIEQTFAMLKSRFRCLDRSKCTLQYSAAKVCEIFTVCCMLHNICILHDLPGPQDPGLPEDPDIVPASSEDGTDEGVQARSDLIREVFS